MIWMTAAEISRILKLPIQEVYRRAHDQRWRRTRTRPVGYHREDVFDRERAALDRDRLTGRDYVSSVGAVWPSASTSPSADGPADYVGVDMGHNSRSGHRPVHLASSGYATLATAIHDGVSAAEAKRDRRTMVSDALADLGQVIYGVQLRDGLIKFGYSTNLPKRLSHYGISPLNPDRLLMVKYGTLVDEQELLGRLARYIAHGREHFHPTPEVVAYINSVRVGMGVPPWRPRP